ncbi:hypothetical protein GGR58DRAFT_161756 [Xylaria digitata]|nr:hypothetical protein GGR58DRAFT_161756 [Xylaria digitata]
MSTQILTDENRLVGLFDPIPHRYMFLPGTDSLLASRCARATQAAGYPVYVVMDSVGKAMGLRVPHYILEPFLREDYSTDTATSTPTDHEDEPSSTASSSTYDDGGLYIEDEPVYSDWEWPDEGDTELDSESDNGESSNTAVNESDDVSRYSSDPTSINSDLAIDRGNAYDNDYDSGCGDMNIDKSEDESSGSEWTPDNHR